MKVAIHSAPQVKPQEGVQKGSTLDAVQSTKQFAY